MEPRYPHPFPKAAWSLSRRPPPPPNTHTLPSFLSGSVVHAGRREA